MSLFGIVEDKQVKRHQKWESYETQLYPNFQSSGYAKTPSSNLFLNLDLYEKMVHQANYQEYEMSRFHKVKEYLFSLHPVI